MPFPSSDMSPGVFLALDMSPGASIGPGNLTGGPIDRAVLTHGWASGLSIILGPLQKSSDTGPFYSLAWKLPTPTLKTAITQAGAETGKARHF